MYSIENEIGNMWGIIAKQSERQYGLFVGLHLLTLGKEANDIQKIKLLGLNSNMVKLRNDIVHKRKFSTYEEAIFRYIITIIGNIKEKLPVDFYKIYLFKQRQEKYKFVERKQGYRWGFDVL